MANFFKHGFVLGSTVAAALPSIPIGYQANLTVVGSTVTDATSGFELEPGEKFLIQGPGNLSSYYVINGSTVANGLTYMVEG
jgi:hypothetical protein